MNFEIIPLKTGVVGGAGVAARVLQRDARDGVLEVRVDEAAVARPLDRAHRRLRVHGALQLRGLVLLHAQRVLGAHHDAGEVCVKEFSVS